MTGQSVPDQFLRILDLCAATQANTVLGNHVLDIYRVLQAGAGKCLVGTPDAWNWLLPEAPDEEHPQIVLARQNYQIVTIITQRQLAQAAGVTVRTLHRCLGTLYGIGWISSTLGDYTGQALVYHLGVRDASEQETYYADLDLQLLRNTLQKYFLATQAKRSVGRNFGYFDRQRDFTIDWFQATMRGLDFSVSEPPRATRGRRRSLGSCIYPFRAPSAQPTFIERVTPEALLSFWHERWLHYESHLESLEKHGISMRS